MTSAAFFMLPVLLFSLVAHEVGHAYVAYRCGDDTAKQKGRLTLNPIPHIDLIGTIIIPAIMLLSPIRLPLIGWAKPVPINPARLTRNGQLAVALGGVTVNFILAFLGAVGLKVCLLFGVFDNIQNVGTVNVQLAVLFVLLGFVIVNLMLMIFNLMPMPPLDGSHVLFYFIRTRDSVLYRAFVFLEQYGFYILIILVYLRVFEKIFIPIIHVILKGFSFVLQIPPELFYGF
jgi:Zn-dependent protease